MARYTDSVCKLCRREGLKLFLKGERCLSPKCAIERRPTPPGMHLMVVAGAAPPSCASQKFSCTASNSFETMCQ